MAVLRAVLGMVVLCLIAWGISVERRRVPWRTIFVGVGIEVALAAFILKTPWGVATFVWLSDLVIELMGMTKAGTDLVFGPLSGWSGPNFVFAFAATGLCTIIFFSALMAILYYLGVMQSIIWCLAKLMQVAMGVSGAEAMAMAANIFVGQTEAGLTVKQYIPRMTKSEIQSLMTGGFATMSAGMIAVYSGLMDGTFASGGGVHVYGPHLLAAEVLSAPAAFIMAKLIRPESESPETGTHFPLTIDRGAHNVLEATANGTRDGLMLYLNVVAMLISFSALVALINWPLGAIGRGMHLEGGLDLGRIFGWVLSPMAWVIGIDWADSRGVASVMGLKVATNEFIAFLQLKDMTPQAHAAARAATMPVGGMVGPAFGYLSQRASILATYAICDFANFVSVGIQIGGFTPMAPERKRDFAAIALRAMIGGCLASWMTAAVAGMFV